MKVRGRRGGREAGWALLVCVFATVLGVGLASVLLLRAATDARDSMLNRKQTQARYLADGGVASAKKSLITAIANFDPVPSTGVVTVDDQTVDISVEPTGFTALTTDPSGIQTILTGFQISATAEVGGIRETSRQIVNVESTPIFQFAVFYENDLEMLPGPDMTLAGRVHTNGDMYLGCGGTFTLDTNHVRAVGGMYRNRKDDPTVSSGTVEIRKWVVDPFDPFEPNVYVAMNSQPQMTAAGVPTTSGYDSSFTSGWDDNGDGDFTDLNDWLPWSLGALDFWQQPATYSDGSGQTVLSGIHGVTEAVPPGVGSVQMFEPTETGTGGDYDLVGGDYVAVTPGDGAYDKGYFHATADLSVLTYTDGSWKAFDGDGNEVTAALAGVVTVSSMYDGRQGGDVQVTEIDVELLNASGEFPANGLLYSGAFSAGQGTDSKGVLLKNGEELFGPLTLVSENATYVQGDYNTVAKKPASVIADAVNLLSNAWDGSKSSGSLPDATETTYNLAMIAGIHDTIGAQYNGGLENLPRFHEDWDNVDCNILGSFVNTWLSTYATGLWVYGDDRYTAPDRNWSYDESFNTVGNLPPFTPMAVTASDVVSW